MGYRGYSVYLCTNGHAYIGPDYYNSTEKPCEKPCPHCGSVVEYIGNIDDTNCDAWAKFTFDIIESRKLVDVCECCNRPKRIEPARYRLRNLRRSKSFDRDLFSEIKEEHQTALIYNQFN